MEYIITRTNSGDELYHYGVKGMKWGTRRYQKKDGTLTSQGKKRYEDSDEGSKTESKKKGLSDKQKKALKIGAAVAGTALAAYGAYKIHEVVRDKNLNLRLEEGKAKCDRMYKKLGRLQIEDMSRGINEKWVKSGPKTAFQYNNNGRNVTVPREYRNTAPVLKAKNYRNIENKITDKVMNDAYDRAKNDSFSTAFKNVATDEYKKASSKVKDSIDSRRRDRTAISKAKDAAKTAKVNAQQDYIKRMIGNTQSHVDPSLGNTKPINKTSGITLTFGDSSSRSQNYSSQKAKDFLNNVTRLNQSYDSVKMNKTFNEVDNAVNDLLRRNGEMLNRR